MFKIYNGATEFKQWDLDQLVVNDCMKEGDEVVFCAHGKAYETTAFVQDGKVVADVPNFLLQESGEIRVDLGWGLDVHLDCRTYLTVTAQAKPKNYVCEYNIKDRTEKGVAGGSTGGDCDWNIMKNKPFYSEIGEVVILPETTVEIDPETGEGDLMDVLSLVVGNTYLVNWNGTAYPCVAESFDMNGIPATALGNIGAITGVGMTDEPFFLLAASAENAEEIGAGGGIVVLDGSTSATISIYTEGEIVKTIDPKYLPEALQFGEERVQPGFVHLDETITAGQSSMEIQLAWYNGEPINCRVVFDGEEYNFVDKVQGEDAIGDPTFVEYPFYIEQKYLGGAIGNSGYFKCPEGEHTVQVVDLEVIPATLPSEYLPKLREVSFIEYYDESELSLAQIADAYNNLLGALQIAGYLY